MYLISAALRRPFTVLVVIVAIALGIPANRARAFVERQSKLRGKGAAAPASAAAPAPAPTGEAQAPAPTRGLSENDIRSFYTRYVDARRSAGDPRPALSFEQLRDRLLAQTPKLLEDPSVRRVNLDVVVEQGKVRVLATPVRK